MDGLSSIPIHWKYDSITSNIFPTIKHFQPLSSQISFYLLSLYNHSIINCEWISILINLAKDFYNIPILFKDGETGLMVHQSLPYILLVVQLPFPLIVLANESLHLMTRGVLLTACLPTLIEFHFNLHLISITWPPAVAMQRNSASLMNSVILASTNISLVQCLCRIHETASF